jgi:hypothetical protein
MLPLLLALLAQAPAPLKAAVVDISASDAIYEDISRGLANDAASALTQAGFVAVRIDESELPPRCRVGPCLGEMARAQGADVVVTLDAEETGPDNANAKVAIAALWGANGEALAGGRYTVVPGKKRPKPLTTFAEASWKAMQKKVKAAAEAKAARETTAK